MQEILSFLESWNVDPSGAKPVFTKFYEWLNAQQDVTISFMSREGVTHSMRGTHKNQDGRPLFVMVDVIDDDPEDRWLSVCFYGDMITDPDEQGDIVPGGLLGSDGHCFDVSEPDAELVEYVFGRIQEACATAGK
ncbi:MAG: hypothetical protein ACNI27_17105 [Desulfovibrio sp.]